jgi:hypothetical protein
LLLAVAIIAVVLSAAWIDAGEEPLRWQTQPVELPGADR